MNLQLVFAFFEVSGGELLVIMMFALIFFGSKKIPEIARGIGKGIREVKDATDSVKKEIQKETLGMRDELREIQEQSRAMIEDVPEKEKTMPSEETAKQNISTELKNPE